MVGKKGVLGPDQSVKRSLAAKDFFDPDLLCQADPAFSALPAARSLLSLRPCPSSDEVSA